MNWDLKTLILAPIITVILIYLAKWIENRMRNKNPLIIKIDSKHLYGGGFVLTGGKLDKINIFIPIIFTNRTFWGFEVFLSNFYFQPKKEIEDLTFRITNSVCRERTSGTFEDKVKISSSTNETRYLDVDVMFSEAYEKKEIQSLLKKYKDIPMILKFNYSISNKPNEEKYYKEIKDFFNEFSKIID